MAQVCRTGCVTMLSEKGSRVIALRGRTSGRALYCGRKVSSLVVRDAGGGCGCLQALG